MNTVDVILGILLFYGLVRGFFRGFFAELASLVGFIVGIYGAIYFSPYFANFIAELVTWNPQIIKILSFAIIFILIVFLISLVGKFLTQAASFVMLGVVNKLLGAAFGFLKAAVITSVIMIFFNATNEQIEFVEEATLDASLLYDPIRAIAPALLPAIIQEVKDFDFPDGEQEELRTAD